MTNTFIKNDPAKALKYFEDKMTFTTGPFELNRAINEKQEKQIDRKSNGDKSESLTGARSMTSDSALELIRARAYTVFESRGRQPGHARDDWLQAEREILRQSSASEDRGFTCSC